MAATGYPIVLILSGHLISHSFSGIIILQGWSPQ